jgi:ubiquinone/menaquinone biosynthesis C-methylase UbiE
MKLKELEDFDWFPAIFRKYQMELIGVLVSKFGIYRHVSHMIHEDLIQQKMSSITDLCSGSGLPAVFVHKNIGIKKLQTSLTDKYPQSIIPLPGVYYVSQSINVLDMPMEKATYYTMYNAFHHFDTHEQQKIVLNALDSNAHLLIVEIVQPTLFNVLSITLASTIGVLLFCPFIKPFEWKRLWFTYVIPINVLTVLIDGYITILKSKSEKQYQAYFKQIFNDDARIKVSSHRRFPANILTIKISPRYD